ncbi:methyltransferase [Frigoribacterium sp. CFBP 13729]|uniref:methyltransferase n=1 Tax=Frigoribacterium sp. CFBP 13729 TaxID=2775293 RepID=UPI00177C3949|nr:methyltransferase [Frigoribacterium sp. CFBP 13729]
MVDTAAGHGAQGLDEEAVVARLRAAGCVFAEDEARLLLEAAVGSELEVLVARRASGEPLEQVLGWAAFDGLRLVVEPGVFVPRRRTELLVRLADAALAAVPGPRSAPGRGQVPLGGTTASGTAPVVVELCCGVGAVSAALLRRRPRLDVVAADLDPVAVRCARRNLGERATVVGGDLFAELPARLRGRVDVLIANAPYVPTAAIATMPPEARLHEPVLALDGGADGLDLHRRIAAGAAAWLSPTGTLVIETSEAQAEGTAALFAAADLVTAVERDDDLDATAVSATRLPA